MDVVSDEMGRVLSEIAMHNLDEVRESLYPSLASLWVIGSRHRI